MGLIFSVFIYFSTLAAGLAPNYVHEVHSTLQSLSTVKGEWSNPAPMTDESKTWLREEFGVHWTWLTIDREKDSEYWYAKLKPATLTIYAMISLFFALVGYKMYENRVKRKYHVARRLYKAR